MITHYEEIEAEYGVINHIRKTTLSSEEIYTIKILLDRANEETLLVGNWQRNLNPSIIENLRDINVITSWLRHDYLNINIAIPVTTKGEE